MAERTIVGVDFSGNATTNATWITKGQLCDSVVVLEKSYNPAKKREEAHKKLAKVLCELPRGAVAALDFPFGVPTEFHKYLNVKATTMDTVWKDVSGISLECFKNKCEQIIKDRGKEKIHPKEPKRRVDEVHYPESMSPLNIRMRPMTYYGISLLQDLHKAKPDAWCVPPLDCDDAVNRTTLLEVMPGALLRVLGLPYVRYKKNYRDRTVAKKNRQRILDGLLDKELTGFSVKNLDQIPKKDLDNDDCLDSLVAVIGAAMWADNLKILEPNKDEIASARLEGCIYAPAKMSPPVATRRGAV